MRKLTLAGVSSLALILAGCATGGTGTTTSGLTLVQAEQDAILGAEALCAVAPTAESITSIIVAASSSAAYSEQTAQAAASAFCKGIVGTKTSVARKAATPRLRAAPVPVGGGVVDYGVLTIGGRAIALQGVPQS